MCTVTLKASKTV